MAILVRPAAPTDADMIGHLAKEFQAYLCSIEPTCYFTWGAGEFLRDGFGNNPAFQALVVEEDDRVIAFTLFHSGYDADHGERGFYMTDLYVSAAHRGRGLGKRLMQEIAAIGRERDVVWIAWNVLKRNASALRFYESVGAKYNDQLHQMMITTDALV